MVSRDRPLQGNIAPAVLARELTDVLTGKHGRAALATVIARSGSAPQIVGAKLLLHEDGTQLGTIGGGAIEAQVLDACRSAIRSGRSAKVQAHLVRDLAMCCGGSMELFVEYLQAQPRLFVIGAGHVAQALVPMAQACDFRVTVLDEREELLGHPAFTHAHVGAYDVDELDVALGDLCVDDFAVIMTHDHARDERALAYLLAQPHRYLGMIGSRRKVRTLLARIEQRAASAVDLSRLHAPIGLALGGRTPAEIAVSVAAELVAARHNGHGGPMSITSGCARVKEGNQLEVSSLASEPG